MIKYKRVSINEAEYHIDQKLNNYALDGWRVTCILNKKGGPSDGGALVVDFLLERESPNQELIGDERTAK